jgi:hypothetical protein
MSETTVSSTALESATLKRGSPGVSDSNYVPCGCAHHTEDGFRMRDSCVSDPRDLTYPSTNHQP